MSPSQVTPPSYRGRGPDISFALRLPRASEAPGAARHVVREHLGDLLEEDALTDTLLVVSELVSDAVRDGDGEIELRVAFDGQRVTGDVTDEGISVTRPPRKRAPEHVGSSLLGCVADSWGLQEGSNHVWFEILADRQPLGVH